MIKNYLQNILILFWSYDKRYYLYIMKANNYYIGQTLETASGFIVTVISVISRRILKVSYGLDSNGSDMIGLINADIHL